MTVPSPSSARPVAFGYFGVIIAVLFSVLFGAGALYQALRYHQYQVADAQLDTLLLSSEHQADQRVVVRVISPHAPHATSGQSKAAFTLLQDEATKTPLKTQADKAWFDAYWSTKERWQASDGTRWAVTPHPLTDPLGARRIIQQRPPPPLTLPWRSLLLAGLGSLTLGFLALRLFALRRVIALVTPLSLTPLLLLLIRIIATRERLTGLPIEGAVLVPLCAALPALCLAITQIWTLGRKSAHRVAYTYMAPTLLSVSTLVFIPFLIGIGLAFTRHDQGTFTWVGLSHFIDILSASDYALTHPLNFYFTLGVTLLWTFVNVVLHTSIGLTFALILNQKGLQLKGVYRALLIIPWAIPNYITALIWKGMFNQQYGLINQVLSSVGLEPVAWMGSFWGAMAANITTNTWLGFPFMMVVTLGALQSVPSDLYDAARIAGASRWIQFKEITLPLLKPALLPAIILGSVWTFNMFNIIYLVSGGQPGNSTDILITEAYRWAFEEDRYGYAAAYSLVIFFILLGYAGLTQKMSRSAEEVYR